MQAIITATTNTQIVNPRNLRMLRIVGWLLVAAGITMAAINTPWFYQYVIDNVRNSAGLTALGVSPELAAIVRSIVRRLGEILFFATAIGVLLRSRDSMAILMAMAWALLAVSLSGALVEISQNFPALEFTVRNLSLISIVLGGLLLFTMPNGQFVPRWGRGLMMLLVILDGVRTVFYGKLPIPNIVLMLPAFITYAIGIGAQLYRFRRGTPIYRHQFKWILFGSAFSLLSLFLVQICYLVLPRDYHILAAGIDEIGSIVIASCMIFAVSRYRLYDINLYVNRTLVFWGVVLILGLLFTLEFFIIRALLETLMGQRDHLLSLLIPATLTGALFNPVRGRIQRFIDRRVYGFRFDLQELNLGQRSVVIKRGGMYTGKTLGGYELFDVIGLGAMGEVYMGQKEGQWAAIKILLDNSGYDTAFLRRFEREAQTTAALQHPNIVKTYGYGESDGLYYLALEFIEGQGLDEMLKVRGKLPLEDVLDLISELASALDTAHAHGIVHRDLKPSNIMVRLRADKETYQPILMDFSIAKMIGGKSTLTGADAVGTIAYMSPEQIMESATVDHRTDIYALGAVLYELLTGQPPFTGTPGQILFSHLEQPAPDAREIVPDLPWPVVRTLMRALEKDPAERFPSAGDLAHALLAQS